jgi:hypothetical protein
LHDSVCHGRFSRWSFPIVDGAHRWRLGLKRACLRPVPSEATGGEVFQSASWTLGRWPGSRTADRPPG